MPPLSTSARPPTSSLTSKPSRRVPSNLVRRCRRGGDGIWCDAQRGGHVGRRLDRGSARRCTAHHGARADSSSQRQNGWPAGSRQTRTSSWGWWSASTRAALRRVRQRPLEVVTWTSRCVWVGGCPGSARPHGRLVGGSSSKASGSCPVPDDHPVGVVDLDLHPEQRRVEAPQRAGVGGADVDRASRTVSCRRVSPRVDGGGPSTRHGKVGP